MSLVQLHVEDEFLEDHSILFSQLDFLVEINSKDMLDFVHQELHKQTKPQGPKDFMTSFQGQNQWKKFAVCCLQTFVAVNWFHTQESLDSELTALLTDFFPDIKSYLELTDESYFDVKNLPLLAVAKFVLGKLSGASLWKVRYMIVHQIVLSVPNTSLYLELKRTYMTFQGFITDGVSDRTGVLLKCQVAVELAQAFLFYTDVGSSMPLIQSVKEFSGISISFSGALGTRTRYQTKSTSQLFVKVEREFKSIEEVPNPSPSLNYPKNVCLEDENLLNEIKFDDGKETVQDISLSIREEVVLFAVACQLRRMSSFATEDEAANEELITLLEYLIKKSRVWCIRFESLHMRSILQRKSTKRIDRSMVQLNHLVDSFDEFESERKKNNALLLENVNLFYATLMTPKWSVQKNLADTLCNLGCTKSALDVYLQIKCWEEMIHCYQVLGRKNKAEETVREQIALQGETPFLLCLLADATDDASLYEKAWQVSGQKYFRAKRDLGNYYFRRKEYEVCKQHYQDSLALNSLQISSWQRLGYAALETQDYNLSVRSYRRFVEFEPDVFEAWNNMAKAYIKLGKKTTAYSTLQEAIKCNFDEWKLWENYLTVSVDIGSFEEVVRSWHRLIELKGKFEDDGIIEILVDAVINDVKDMNGNPGGKLAPRLLQLFARIKGTAYNTYTLWISYARLLQFTHKDVDSVVDVIRRANRALVQNPKWDKEPCQVKNLLDNLLRSLDILVQEIGREEDASKRQTAISSTRLTIESTIRGAEKSVSEWDPSKVDLKPINDSLEAVRSKISLLNSL